MKRLRLRRFKVQALWEVVADGQLIVLWGYGLWHWTLPTLLISSLLIRVALLFEYRRGR